MYEITPHYLPEEKVPQDPTGCTVETPPGWVGTVGKPLGDGLREVDFGRGDIGARTEKILRGRVTRLPASPQ
jgi:hypothetical protein